MSTVSTEKKFEPRLTENMDGWITLYHAFVWSCSGIRCNEPVHIKASSIREVRPRHRGWWGSHYQGDYQPVHCAVFTTGSTQDPAYFVHGTPSEILSLIGKAKGA